MSSVARNRFRSPIWHSEAEKKAGCGESEARKANFHVKPGSGLRRISTKLRRLRLLTGIFDDFVS
jgi:hypothetical protein